MLFNMTELTLTPNLRLMNGPHAADLQDILEHSLFRSEMELRQQFTLITAETGTRIVIYTLKR